MGNIVLLLKCNNSCIYNIEEAKEGILDRLRLALKLKKQEISLGNNLSGIIDTTKCLVEIFEVNEEIIREAETTDESENKNLLTGMFMANIVLFDSIDKFDFLTNLNNEKLFFSEVIVLLDNESNKKIKESYIYFNKLENILRIMLALNGVVNQKNMIFKALDELKVNSDPRTNEVFNFKNMLHRTTMDNLFNFIHEHNRGGNEKDIFAQFIDEENYTKLKQILSDNIFAEIERTLQVCGIDGKTVKEWRNLIAHNAIIDVNIFEKYNTAVINAIDKYTNEIINFKLFDQYKIKSNFVENNILLIIENSYFERYSENEFRLFFSKILNEVNMLYDKEVKVTTSEDQSVCTICLKDEITTVELFLFKTERDDESSIFLLNIECEKEEFRDIIFERLNKLFIDTKVLYLFDKNSQIFSNKLFAEINDIENNLRAYIKLQTVINEIITEEIKAKNQNADDLRTVALLKKLQLKREDKEKEVFFVNNELYTNDFKDLKGKLLTPLGGDLKKLKKALQKKLKEDPVSKESLLNLIYNINDMDENLSDLINMWDELYAYRTVIAHNNYITQNEFSEISTKIKNAQQVMNKLLYKYFKEVFNLTPDDYSGHNEIIKFTNDKGEECKIFNVEFKEYGFNLNADLKNIIKYNMDISNISYFDGVKLLTSVLDFKHLENKLIFNPLLFIRTINSDKEGLKKCYNSKLPEKIYNYIKEYDLIPYYSNVDLNIEQIFMRNEIGDLLVRIEEKKSELENQEQ